MLGHYMRICEVNVTLHHVQRCVAQNLLQTEHVSAINQVIEAREREGDRRPTELLVYSSLAVGHYRS